MESVINFISTLPTWVKIFMTFIIVPLYFLKDSIGTVIKTISLKNILKKKTSSKNIESLLVHDFFISLRDLYPKVEQIDFSQKNKLNSFKRKMMLKLIEVKMTAIEEGFKEIINSPDILTLGSQEFKYEVLSCIRALIKKYNKQAINHYLEMGVTEEDAFFFVNSYEGYRETIIESFINRLESITVSKQYHNNYERMLAMLEVLTVAVEVIPRDVKSLYFIINGKYDKYDI